jgi:hypothetical protein
MQKEASVAAKKLKLVLDARKKNDISQFLMEKPTNDTSFSSSLNTRILPFLFQVEYIEK